MLADAPALLSESTGDQTQDMTYTFVGLSAGCSRALMMTANPLHEQDGNEAEGIQSTPSFGTYSDSDDGGPGLHMSSGESVPDGAGEVDGSSSDDSFAQRFSILARELEAGIDRNANRRVRRRRLCRSVLRPVVRPPGLAGEPRTVEAFAMSRDVRPHACPYHVAPQLSEPGGGECLMRRRLMDELLILPTQALKCLNMLLCQLTLTC